MEKSTKIKIGAGVALVAAIIIFKKGMWSGESIYTRWRDKDKPLKGVKGAPLEYRNTPRKPEPEPAY